MSELTKEEVALLSEKLPKSKLSVKVQATNRDKTRALLVCYLQHTDVYDKIEQVDTSWSCNCLSITSEVIEDKLTFICRMNLTVKGISRENVGEGDTPKAAVSDALKRCAMLFGVGRYLYDAQTVWVPYNDQNDRYRQWTVDDYAAGLK